MGRDELAAYPTVELRDGAVSSGERDDGGSCSSWPTVARDGAERAARDGNGVPLPRARRHRRAVGPSVFHCPFCHGWEVRDRPLGVLDPARRACMLAAAARLERRRDAAHERAVRARRRGRRARCGRRASRSTSARSPGCAARASALTAVDVRRRLRAPLRRAARAGHAAPALAARRAARGDAGRAGAGRADAVAVDAQFQTDVPGLSAAGDATAQMPSVATAVYTGSAAAAGIVGGLMVT